MTDPTYSLVHGKNSPRTPGIFNSEQSSHWVTLVTHISETEAKHTHRAGLQQMGSCLFCSESSSSNRSYRKSSTPSEQVCMVVQRRTRARTKPGKQQVSYHHPSGGLRVVFTPGSLSPPLFGYKDKCRSVLGSGSSINLTARVAAPALNDTVGLCSPYSVYSVPIKKK